MSRRLKIAVSLSSEVLEMVDRIAGGRSRSRCIEEVLLKALRAAEWERLSAQTTGPEQDDLVAWAHESLAFAHGELARDEQQATHQPTKARRARRSVA